MSYSSPHAVIMLNVTKQYAAPGYPSWPRPARLSSRGTGPLNRAAQATKALDNLSLSISEGEIFGIYGPQGSGKSTLVRLLAGLVTPDSGEIHIFGCDVVRRRAQAQRQVNRVSASASFFKQLSAAENLLNAARLYGISTAEAQSRVLDVLRRLGLDEFSIRQALETTSRSVQQKVSIACALIARPRLLLLDEPMIGLDSSTRREVQRVIREQRDEFGMTVVFTTQDITLASDLSERLAVLDNGRLVSLDGGATTHSSGEADLVSATTRQKAEVIL